MLPELPKKKYQDLPTETRFSQPKLDIDNDTRNMQNTAKSVSSKKVRTGGGFMKSNVAEENNSKGQYLMKEMGKDDQYIKFVKVRKPDDLSAEIKLIEKKIKACQRKIDMDRKKEKQLAEQNAKDKSKPDYDFDKVVERQLLIQSHNYAMAEPQHNNNFDYLTNPKLNPHEEIEEIPESVPIKAPLQENHYSIQAGIEKMQKFYESSLKKKFERREMFPHQACRRKTPKLYITQKTNGLNKFGKAKNETQHMFRVLTKQTTPHEIYPTIPNFAVVKDNLSKNIVAYLGDYKPFLDKTKEGLNQHDGQESEDANVDMMGDQNGENSQDISAPQKTSGRIVENST